MQNIAKVIYGVKPSNEELFRLNRNCLESEFTHFLSQDSNECILGIVLSFTSKGSYAYVPPISAEDTKALTDFLSSLGLSAEPKIYLMLTN